jgi:hypothetical protein
MNVGPQVGLAQSEVGFPLPRIVPVLTVVGDECGGIGARSRRDRGPREAIGNRQ